MTKLDLPRLLKETEGATPGPWWACRKTGQVQAKGSDGYARCILTSIHFTYEQKVANELLIDAAPLMRDELVRLTEERDRLVEALEEIDALDTLEINLCNYDEVDVERLNGCAIQAGLIAQSTLKQVRGE